MFSFYCWKIIAKRSIQIVVDLSARLCSNLNSQCKPTILTVQSRFLNNYNREAIRDSKSGRLEVNMYADGKLDEQLCPPQHAGVALIRQKHAGE